MDVTFKFEASEFLEKLDLEAYDEHETLEVETDESGNVVIQIKGVTQ